jgi:rRNA-processing protein FCF1
VKRNPSIPLLRAGLPAVYLIDTSAWLNIDTRQDFADVWQLVISLIQQGRIVVPAAVLNELRDNPMYLSRLQEYEAVLQAGDRKADDLEYLMLVGKITHDYPAMSGARGIKTKADPYIVALADLEKYIVVTDESLKHENRKIPGVCKHYGITCLTLDEFVRTENEAERKATEAG